MWFMYRNLDTFWNYSLKTFPFRRLTKTFVGVYISLNVINTAWSLTLEDYCKRNSAIYDTKQRGSKEIMRLIRETNQEHKKTLQGKAKTSLSDEEIINSK